MPAVPKTSDRAIVGAARKIIAREGAESLSLAAVASAVGIKAPSLYKRFAHRASLVEAVREDVLEQLAKSLAASARHRDPVKQLVSMARTYRRFGKENPQLYRLIMVQGGQPTVAARAAIAPVFTVLAAVVGEKAVLPAGRCLTAFLHGFVSMEINGSFQLGGSVDLAFEFGLGAIVKGLIADGVA